MKILKLSPYFFPEQVSSSHLTEDVHEAFCSRGDLFEVYAPTPTRGISEEIRNRYKKIRYEEFNNGSVVLHRFPMFREGRNPILRALRYVFVNLLQYVHGTRSKSVDVILAGSTPPTQGILCGLVKKRLSKRYGHKVPLIFNLQDIFPDSLVNAKMTHKGSLIWKIGRKMEDFTYRNADLIIVISEDFKQNILEKGVPEDKIIVVPNWIDTEKLVSVSRKDNVLFDRYSLDRDKFYICYSGNIGHSQNLKLLINAAKSLQEELPDVCFVIVGEGAAKESLKIEKEALGLSNMVILPFQPYEEIAHVFSLGDVGLIISKPGIGKSSVPSKTWSIMSVGRPILASFDGDSEVAKLISAEKCGIVAEADNLEQLLQAIHKLYANKMVCREMGNNGRNYVKQNFDKSICTNRFVNCVHQLFEQGIE